MSTLPIGQISKMNELSRVENASMVPFSPEPKFENLNSRATIESSWAKRAVEDTQFDSRLHKDDKHSSKEGSKGDTARFA